jgi:ABC-type lipopolysaccharide export system ATPase subunit
MSRRRKSITGTPEQLGNDPELTRMYLGESFTLV